MTDRLIIDDDYYWVDTLTGERVDVDDSFDIVNKLDKENTKLRAKVDRLENDNEKYYLTVERLGRIDDRFEITDCKTEIIDNKTNRAYWLEHEKNVESIVELLNHLNKEIKDYKDILQLLHEDMNYVKDLIFEYGSEELVSKYINRCGI
ncbi:hypothetical protein [Methanobrevibacter sp. V74]|uniref:hypothetical protein n=1 Tax=Methanobrevibacter sp. V74 TaxID=3064279 RepID=UPI002735651C|nr:hypothetical protein [Methanobrevibacter sp. V74]